MTASEKQTVHKRKRGIETTNKILEVSAALFARKGFDGTSLQEISDAVGIKESSLYNHFRSKEGILEALLQIFREKAPESRPSEAELEKMLMIMEPEEIFKNILFYFGRHENPLVENAAMVINNEKYKRAQAAETYFQCVVKEPSDYYERLIRKMSERGMIGQVDARMFAEQYNYVSISLTKEYFMVKNGLADMQSVIKYMIKTISFFCGLMRENAGDLNHGEKT